MGRRLYFHCHIFLALSDIFVRNSFIFFSFSIVPVTPVNVSVSNVKVTSTVIKWLGPYEDGGSAIIEYIRINTIPPREIITRATFYVIKKVQ